MTKIAVVGSGPAGTFCAKSLIARGLKVTMLDAGETLDERRQGIIDTLGNQPKEEWDPGLVAEISENPTVHSQRIPSKLAFGSDYVYGRERSHSALDAPKESATPSFALGGFSVVWGASVLPWPDKDLVDWPFGRAALDPYYRKVLDDLPLTGEAESFGGEFPAIKDSVASLAATPQGKSLLQDLAAARDDLAAVGVLAGRARLAVHERPGPWGQGCVHCGQCLTGCPTGAIYSCAPEIAALERTGSLEYRSGMIVRSVTEDLKGVDVEMVRAASGEALRERFDHVFMAAGPISSTRIMMQSLGLFGETVNLRDSQKLLVPMLRRKRVRANSADDANVLASAFLEINDPAVSPHWIHLKLSPASRLVRAKFSPLAPLAGPLLDRLMIAWCGIHSDHSGSISLRLSGAGHDNVLALAEAHNPEADVVISKLAKKLRAVCRLFDSFALTPLIRKAGTGISAQMGGSFPMSENPTTKTASDTLGRPAGFRRVYMVDSSVFPSVPAPTMALTVMANAYRIGTEAALD